MGNLKLYHVRHLTGNRRTDTSVISTSRLKASTYCEGQILDVSQGTELEEGNITGSSSWNMHGWSGGFDTKVSSEWIGYLKEINLNNGEED